MENIAKIKKAVNIPVIGVGRVNMPALANKLIEDGEIDMIAIGRAQLADPEWCNKAREGREDEISSLYRMYRRMLRQGYRSERLHISHVHVTQCSVWNTKVCQRLKRLRMLWSSVEVSVVW